jgi:c-di-GMP-binding flagellar brake protein YcgR
MEKRLYERISLPIRLTYEVKTRPKDIRESISRDVSGNGICISLKEKLLPNTELDINISIANNDDKVKLKGKVVWSRRIEITTEDLPININRIITHFYGKSF